MNRLLKIAFLIISALSLCQHLSYSFPIKQVIKKSARAIVAIPRSFKNSDQNLGIDPPDLVGQQDFTMTPSLGFGVFFSGDDYFRMDSLKIAATLDPLGLSDALPVYGNLGKSYKGTFVRRFENIKKAKLARPKTLPFLPYNDFLVEKVIKEGETLLYESDLSMLVSGNLLVPVTPINAYNTGGKYVVTGGFDVAIQGLTENHYRVRISPKLNHSIGHSQKFTNMFWVTEVELAEQFVDNYLFFNLFNKERTVTLKHTFVYDYIFNFNDQKARKAFNELLINPKIRLKEAPLLDIVKRKNRRLNHYISSATLAEKLAIKDHELPIEKKRVFKYYKGKFDSLRFDKTLDIGLLIYKKSFQKSIKQHLFEEEIDQSNKRFYFPIYNKTISSNLAYGLYPNFNSFDLFQFFILDENMIINKENALAGIQIVRREHSMNMRKLRKLKKTLLRILPISLYSKIEWRDDVSMERFKIPKGPRNFKIFFRILFSPAIFEELKNITYKDLHHKWNAYFSDLLSRNLVSRRDFSYPFYFYRIQKRQMLRTLINFISHRKKGRSLRNQKMKHLSLNGAKKMVLNIPNSGINLSDHEEYMNFSDSALFQKLGVGFLLNLIEADKNPDLVRIDLSITSPDAKSVSFGHGMPILLKEFQKINNLRFGPHWGSTDYLQILP